MTNKKRPLRRVAAALAAASLVVAACGGDDDDAGDDAAVEDGSAAGSDEGTDDADDTAEDATSDDGGTASDGETAAAGGTLIAGIGAEPDRFDPHLTTAGVSFQVLENVFDTLVQPGADLTMEPALATDWSVSEDNLTWTFNLRDGVTFHDGSEFTADDVVYSYERIMDPDTGAGNAFRFANVESVTAVDPMTVEIAVTQPTPNLLELIGSFKGMAIVSEDNVSDGSIDTSPVGTGPFVFDEYVPGEGITLTAFDGYWQDGMPMLDEIDFRIIPDPTVLLTNLETGEVDWIDSVPPSEIEDLQSSDDIVVGTAESGDYHYFALNQEREPFDDVRVRQAIATAINRAEITEAAQFGAATANQAAVPEASFWYSGYAPYPAEGDVDAAQALLDEAGVGELEIEFLVSSEFPETVTQAQVIAAQLEPLGITVSINDVDFATWLDLQGQGEFDAFMLSWIGNLDPDDFYYAQHHSEGGFNFQGYSNPEVDALLDEARAELDQEARKALYDQAAEIIVDEASYIYLYNPLAVNAWSSDVSGYETLPSRAVRFVEASVS